MYCMKDEQKHEIKSNLCGGNGDLDFQYIFPPEWMLGAGKQVCLVTFQPGQSIGLHAHVDNAEAYYILEGEATVTDDGEERILKPGDTEHCANSHTHSIANNTDKPMKMLAIILNNFTLNK